MGEEFDIVMKQLYLLMLKMGTPVALFSFAFSALKSIAGDKDAIPSAVRQIGVGLFVLIVAPTIVYFIVKIAGGFNISPDFVSLQ